MHLKFENYWFIEQMCEDVTILQIAKKVKKYCHGYHKI